MTPSRTLKGHAAGWCLAMLFVVLAPAVVQADAAQTVVVGAKKFTEATVLGELVAQVLERHAGAKVERRFNLAGTQICFEALRSGAIDVYPEYSGTVLRSILRDQRPSLSRTRTAAIVSRRLRQEYNLLWLAPFGFNNTYVLIMRRDHASRLGVSRISQLKEHALTYGVSHEFGKRPDGLRGLRKRYSVDAKRIVFMEHDLVYQALAAGEVDVVDAYSTDAKLAGDRFAFVTDDKKFFPPYEAAPVVRADLLKRLPQAAAALSLLAGRLNAETMRRLNHLVEGLKHEPTRVAADFLQQIIPVQQHLKKASDTPELRAADGFFSLLWRRRAITFNLVLDHLLLTGIALLGACFLGIPLGMLAARRPMLRASSLGIAGVLQTIPSIALLAFMLPLLGIGAAPAIAALFIYALLPILRNTISGLSTVDPALREVAMGLGMTPKQIMWRVELPLAVPVLLAGIRIAAVISVGTATLAAFIGAGGLGDPIVTGLSTNDFDLVLTGALPAAALAMLVDGLLARVEHLATPRGIRLQR